MATQQGVYFNLRNMQTFEKVRLILYQMYFISTLTFLKTASGCNLLATIASENKNETEKQKSEQVLVDEKKEEQKEETVGFGTIIKLQFEIIK